MKLSLKHILPILFFFIYVFNATAAQIYSVSSKDWDDPDSWNTNTVPGINDDVIIDGHKISIASGVHFVNSLIVTNVSEAGGISELHLDDSGKLIVSNNLHVDSPVHDTEVKIHLLDNSFLEVLGSVYFTRGANNNTTKKLQLEMLSSAKFKVHNDFSYNYSNSDLLENNYDIYLSDYSYLEVVGNMILNISGGSKYNLEATNNSKLTVGNDFIVNASGGIETNIYFSQTDTFIVSGNLQINNSGNLNVNLEFNNNNGLTNIGGDLSLTSNGSLQNITVDIYGGAIVSINEDISISATGDGDVAIDVSGTSEVNLGGNVQKSEFGAIRMGNNTKLILNGTSAQEIPKEDLSGVFTDEFYYSNLEINNTSNLPLPLTSPLTIEKDLELKNGIIKTTDTNILTLKEDAVITGASPTAFIDGPMIKQGTSGGDPFVFPIGKETTYAPIQVSALSNPNTEIKATYKSAAFGDPPPWGSNFESGIDNINTTEYWQLEKTAVSENPKVTLAWDGATNINNLNDLTVVRLNETDQEWKDFGNNGTTGTTTTGTITSTGLLGDPPPWGIESFTLGSKSSSNALPVELTKFQAVQQDEIVHLQWETATELNTREFIIEHSTDGIRFESIGTEFSNGNSNVTNTYTHQHRTPIEGINYYRLRIVDLDNSFEHSHIEVVKFDKETKLKVFPNPVTKFLHIHGEFTDYEDVMFEVYDRSGKEIYMGTISFDNGRFMIDTDSINITKPGTYFLRITSRADSFIQKFIKTN